ncbi:unnamed protein product [Absidia cylindrospora]
MASAVDNYSGDWMDNDGNSPQLPTPWVKRAVPQGGTCFYNLATHEVAWDINDIMDLARETTTRTGSPSQNKQHLELPKPQPRSPARKMTIRRGSVISVHEPLTWKKLSIHIALAIHNLSIAARNSNTPSFEPYAAAIVDAIRFMLLASGTVDKDSVYLRTNSVLRAHHRTTMASLSKLILSSQACAHNPTDNVSRMLADSNELLLAARNFISAGEAIPVHVQHVEPQLELRSASSLSSSSAAASSAVVAAKNRKKSKCNSILGTTSTGGYRPKYILDGDLAENIEAYGNNLQEALDGMIHSITTYKQQMHTLPAGPDGKQTNTTTSSSPRSSLFALLFTQFRNFSDQSGQFLAIFDDVDYTGFQSSPEMMELDLLRQKLYQGVGDLLCRFQVLTDEDVPLDASTDASTRDGNEIKKIIDAICHCMDKLAFDPSIRQQNSGNVDIPEASMFGASSSSQSGTGYIDEDDMDDDSLYTDAVTSGSIGSGSHEAAISPTSMTAESISKGNDAPGSSVLESDTNQTSSRRLSNTSAATSSRKDSGSASTLHRSVSTSPDHPRQSNAKLKKFFGDDVPEQLPQTPASVIGKSATVAGGPPNAAMDAATTGDPSKDEKRPWYLQYDYKPNEIVFNMEGSVKGGTLLALVIRLTLHDYLDMNFINTFLLTYRSFCSSMELLTLLEKRYTRDPPDGLTEQEMDIWMNKKLKLIRLRVFNVLKNWLEQYYNEDDYVILDELLRFTTTTIRSTLRFSAEQLERLIKKRQEATGDGLKKMVLTFPTAPPMPILPRNRKKFRLLDIDPLEVARQMTMMDFKLYSSIRPVECLNKAWSKDAGDDQAHVAANIRASIEYCNQVTSWVSDAILSQVEVKKRVTLIKHWVQIAERCRQLNNFNTCMAILSAFDNSAVGRLKRTWEMVGARTNQILSQIRKLMGANRNFVEYRAIIHSINPPCIPFLGIYLQDLTFIEDGNSDFLKTSKDMINFAKRAKTAEVIREIQQYQSTYYQLTVVDELQTFIQTNLQSTRDEEQLYNESLKLEPR